MSEILKEAIADAKKLKETALANAKQVLQESMDTKLQSLISKKIEEMEDMDDDLDIEIDEAELLGGEEKVAEKEEEEKKEEVTEATDDEIEIEIVDDEEEKKEEEKVDEAKEEGSEEIDLDAVLKELEDEESNDNETEEKKEEEKVEEGCDKKYEQLEAKLAEAKTIISKMKQSLVESNLVNSKLVYLTKLFKNHTFSTQQKERMVEVFDKANKVNEVRLTYEVLVEAITSNKQNENKTKKRIAEGLASKTSKATNEKQVLVEQQQVDDSIKRMQKLAGINI